ncbi:hypothetical protein F5884DRAFT_470427 [Xylogone sp. PMI_703]|nr:hypothetical protein F5884DRAFT_470427 [Xylogone sp. PMI_703]
MEPTHLREGVKRRACTNCTVAKAKCTPYNHDICERCQRLRKHCVYLTVSQTRRKPRETGRVQKLEEKLEGLIKELGQLHNQNSSTLQTSSSSSSAQATSPEKLPSTTSQDVLSSSVSVPSATPNIKLPTGGSSWSDAAPTPSLLHDDDSTDIIDRGILTLDYARTLLDTFNYSYAAFFPFIVLPASTTVESLRREKPFLFLVIMAAAAFSNTPLQHFLGKEIQKQVAIKMIVCNERSLDMLQGLVIYLAYGQYFFSAENQQITLMTQLALTLVFELGLHHSPRPKKFVGPPEDFGKMGSAERCGKRTTEEIRAFLAIFVLSDDYARMFRKQHLLCDPEFAVQCTQELVEANERSSDKWIQHYVQITILSRQVNDTFSYHNPKYSKIMGEASICAVVDSFKRELEHVRRAAKEDNQEASLFREFQLLDLWIHEVAFHDVLWENPVSGRTTARHPVSPTRINMLWHCLSVAKVYLTDFLDIPRLQMFHKPCITFSNICYAVIIFCKAVLFHSDKDMQHQEGDENCIGFPFQENKARPEIIWDSAIAAQEGEFYRVSSALHDKFAALVTTTDTGNGNVEVNAMWHFSIFVRRILTGYERHMVQSGAEKEPQQSDLSGSDNNNENSVQSTSSIPTQHHILSNMNTDIGNTVKGQFSNGMLDTDNVSIPFNAEQNIPADWSQDIAWETILEDIMMMPVPSR